MDKGAAEYINLQLEALSTTLPSALRAHLNVELTESSFDVSGKDDIENLILSLSSMLSSCSQEYSSFGKFSSSNQVFGQLVSMGYYLGDSFADRSYDAITLLISELEDCIMKGNVPFVGNIDEDMDIDDRQNPVLVDSDSTGRIAIQLDKICRLLKIDSSSANNSLDVISLIQSYIQQILAEHPRPEQILHLETILSPSTVLTDGQKATQQHLEEALQQDFAIRRQMMLTRFEVTLESLLGEDSETVDVEDDTARVRAAVKAQLRSINRQPFLYRWEDALQAPVAVFYEQSKKVTGESYSSAGSVVKKVVVGPVPDRGGRVNELRQKKFFEEKRHGGGKYYNNSNKNNKGPAQGGNDNKGGQGGGKNSGYNRPNSKNSNNDGSCNNNSGGDNSEQSNNSNQNNNSGRTVTVVQEESTKSHDEPQRKKGRR